MLFLRELLFYITINASQIVQWAFLQWIDEPGGRPGPGGQKMAIFLREKMALVSRHQDPTSHGGGDYCGQAPLSTNTTPPPGKQELAHRSCNGHCALFFKNQGMDWR